MAKSRLSEKALYVERGYGQVEPNHLSAQRTGQIYAQLPAKAGIEVLEKCDSPSSSPSTMSPLSCLSAWTAQPARLSLIMRSSALMTGVRMILSGLRKGTSMRMGTGN